MPAVIALGANTDPYQPIERRLRITRAVLEVLAETRHPVGIVTKSALVVRDLDLLRRWRATGLVEVHISVTTLDPELARTHGAARRDPAPAPGGDRGAGARPACRSGVMVAPVIPGLNDHEIEPILEAAAEAGARRPATILSAAATS